MSRYFILVLLGFPSIALALDLACPDTITTRQSLANPVPSWETSLPEPLNGEPEGLSYLSTAFFTEGPPSHHVGLLPDIESAKVGKYLDTWNFEDSSKIWLACVYRGTYVSLAKRLPAGIKSCTIASDRKKGIQIESISCK